MEKLSLADMMSITARNRLQASAIAAISELRSKHPGISFSAGEPDEAFYPVEELKIAFSQAVDDASILNYYASDMGYVPLREWLSVWMKEQRTAPSWVTPDNILLTHGAAEGINDVAELFIDPGTEIAVEEATYVEAVMDFRKQGAVCHGVRMDEDGLVPEEFERLCQSRDIRMLYTIPCFQNPTGRTASSERRRQIFDLCRRYGVLILEDDPYRYLSYDGAVPDTYFSMAAENDRIVYCSSFSKVIAPGVRTGWLVLPPSVAARFDVFQICGGLIQQPLTHKMVHIYLQRNDIAGRIAFLQEEYRKRRDSLSRELKEQLEPLGMHVNRPAGGFFLWGSIDGIDDMMDFVRYAIINEGIAVIPGESFVIADAPAKNVCRLSLSKVTPQLAREGCARLARAIRNYRK
jgi:2-aminoadipate transaminase